MTKQATIEPPITTKQPKMAVSMLPYQTHVSLVPLIEAIERKAQGSGGGALLARQLLAHIAEAPELRQTPFNEHLLEIHSELIEMLMTFVVPAGSYDQQLIKICEPFSSIALYESKAIKQKVAHSKISFKTTQNENMAYCATLIQAASLILNKFYDQNLDFDPPFLVTIQEEGESLPHFYKAKMDLQYLDVHHKGDLPTLTQDTIDDLLTNIYDAQRWLEVLPPDKFEFHGFMVTSLHDITVEEALSQIKHQLLNRDAILDRGNIDKLEQLLRVYLNVPDLILGITAIDYPKNRTAAHKYKIRFDFLADQVPDLLHDNYTNSLYDKVCRFREVMLIEDIKKNPVRTPLEEKLLARGIRSLLLATLTDTQDNVIGLVELGSPRPYGLHSFVELKFKDILGLFRTAVRRSREEVDNQIEAIIREQYTALHPSVEWRFVKEAFRLLEAPDKARAIAQAEPIMFQDIYPLYGQADIVRSSHQRNEAIRADLVTELTLIRKVLKNASEKLTFPLVNRLLLDVERDIHHLGETYNSSDETRILDLIQQRAQPLLLQLSKEYSELNAGVKSYFNQLDPKLKMIYRQRKDYEKSVEAVNNLISSYLNNENAKMQEVIPHYFERYKTDGVEYDMYIGQSLLREADRFSDIHLANFRLWQLIQMCEITRKVEELRTKLPVPLTTAQLIFAYTSSLSIQFRMDEKRFDVDGAYNVRYEILKKRIDKAVIEGTNERITQPGHVAVIYLQDKDRQEYFDYAEYLLSEGYLTEPPVSYKLAPLQGVQGLKALRMRVRI